jgi:hypothetical protein
MSGPEVRARTKAQPDSESQNRFLRERNYLLQGHTTLRITSLPIDYK